ncbi:MAG: glycosyltransferase family 39 protein [Bifidobacteriaceae bacterium]|nr:glycosyltransferase family 39 protein [Bifidobacteriaceae bacterium]
MSDQRTDTGAKASTDRLAPARRDYLAVFAVALLVRVAYAAWPGTWFKVGPYDEGVYYMAARLLAQDVMPYRDFTFVHPPGMLELAAPLAGLGAVTSDHVALVVGRLLAMAVSAGCAAAMVYLCRDLGRVPALIAGATYALWLPQITTDQSMLLEGPMSLALIAAMMALFRLFKRPTLLTAAVLGFALAWAVGIKLWALGPAVAIAAFGVLRLRWRSWALVSGGLVGLALSTALIWPAGPGAAISQFVGSQTGRAARAWMPRAWLEALIGPLAYPLFMAAALGVLVWLLVVAARRPATNWEPLVWIATAAVLVLQLISAQNIYPHYLTALTPAAGFGLAYWVRRLTTAAQVADAAPAASRQTASTATEAAVAPTAVQATQAVATTADQTNNADQDASSVRQGFKARWWDLFPRQAKLVLAGLVLVVLVGAGITGVMGPASPAWQSLAKVKAAVGTNPGCVWAEEPGWLIAAGALPEDWLACRSPVDRIGMLLQREADGDLPEAEPPRSAGAMLEGPLDQAETALVFKGGLYDRHLQEQPPGSGPSRWVGHVGPIEIRQR